MVEEKDFVNQNLEAIITIELSNSSQIDCVLDTGFYGNLVLPREFAEENMMRFTGAENIVMIEDKVIEMTTAKADVKWIGDNFSITVLVSEKPVNA